MNDPEWAQTVVMDSLASLPALEDLRISLGGAPASSFETRTAHEPAQDHRLWLLPQFINKTSFRAYAH
jgi:hypothetical protein